MAASEIEVKVKVLVDLSEFDAAMARMREVLAWVPVVHRCPPKSWAVTPCCGRTPFELPRTDRMTVDSEQVTCSLPCSECGGSGEVWTVHEDGINGTRPCPSCGTGNEEDSRG
jgi:hypothetical protein